MPNYTVALSLPDEDADTPEGAVESFLGAVSKLGHTFVYEVTDNATGDRWVIDMDGYGDITPMSPAAKRLEELRVELRAERISMSELVELQSLVEHIDPGDVELLEAAGVPEHNNDDNDN